MKRPLLRIFLFSVVVFLMAACATSKKSVQPEQPKHRSAEVKRAMVKVESGGNRISVGCQLQTVFDSVCIVSVQPLSGMEMFALHAMPDRILLIDRMNKRYAITDYLTINTIVSPKIDYRMLENMISGNELPQGLLILTKHFTSGNRQADVTISFPEIIYDQLRTTRPLKIDNYKQTDIKTLIKSLL